MKNLKYVLVFVAGLLLTACTEQNITPRGEGEDDPIGIPPPPPPPATPPGIGG